MMKCNKIVTQQQGKRQSSGTTKAKYLLLSSDNDNFLVEHVSHLYTSASL